MRVTLDLDEEIFIVPDKYFTNVDKMNELIEKNGGNKLGYTEYIKKSALKAIEKAENGSKGIFRKSDVTTKKK